MLLQGGQGVATRQGTDLHPTRRRQPGAYKATNGTGTDYANFAHCFLTFDLNIALANHRQKNSSFWQVLPVLKPLISPQQH
jgi:hypothetical protein